MKAIRSVILDNSGIKAMGRLSEGEVGVGVLRSGRIKDFFHEEGNVLVVKERFISSVRIGTDSVEVCLIIVLVMLS